MIHNIIFDFGNVLINLSEEAPFEHMRKIGLVCWNEDLDNLNKRYEKGSISEETYFSCFQKFIPNRSVQEIKDAWNAIVDDVPHYRLEFLKAISKKYKLFLLCNIDKTHKEKFESSVSEQFKNEFYSCFQKIYFSHNLGIRKPNPDIFSMVLEENNLHAEETLFIDDNKHHTDVAENMNIKTWHLLVGEEDVTDLNNNHKLD